MAQTSAFQGTVSDPHLWLYDPSGQLVAANDDTFGLHSYISFLTEPGLYRLRAGYCCGDPDAVRQGWAFNVQVSASPVPIYSTTEPTTTTTEPTTTTEQPTTTQEQTTTVQPTTIPTDPAPTTDPEPSTTVEPATTTSQPPEPSTTVPPEPPSTVSPTTTQPALEPEVSTTPEQVVTTAGKPATTSTVLASTTTLQEATTTPTEPVATTQPPVEPTAPEPETLEILPPLENLTDAEAAVLVQQLNNAPDELKRQFEEQVNVFSGQFDSYVPADQRIPVGERRTLIAVTATLVTLGATAPSRKFRR